jgi:hypothetical protein
MYRENIKRKTDRETLVLYNITFFYLPVSLALLTSFPPCLEPLESQKAKKNELSVSPKGNEGIGSLSSFPWR